MNRTSLLIAVAAIAIAGVGVGLLLPALESGPLAGSIAPQVTTIHPVTTAPAPRVAITVAGTYSPYRTWNDNVKAYDWYWNLHSANTYEATHLPAGVALQKVAWTITGTLEDGRTTTRVSRYSERFAGWPEAGLPPQELALAGSYAIDDGFSWAGCYGPDLCPASEWVTGPPFTASCTVTTTDGRTFTRSAELVRA